MKRKLLALAALASASLPAMAELPAAVGTAFTGVATNAEDIFDLAFPVVATIAGLMIVIKLFKRFSAKV